MSRNAVFFVMMCLVWGVTFLPIKIAADYAPPIFLATVRFSLAGVLMLLWAGRDAFRVPRAASAAPTPSRTRIRAVPPPCAPETPTIGCAPAFRGGSPG